MSTEARIEPVEQTVLTPHWCLAKRLAFRFLLAYLGLYCMTTQILLGFRLPKVGRFAVPVVGTLWPLRQITFWTAAHIFQIHHALIYKIGTGDKTFDWVQAFCLLVFAALATMVWSFLDKRENYVSLDQWFRLFLRFVLASEMFLYGFAKIIPDQMPFPYLTRWVEPFGNFTPMGVLWNSIGASPGYEIFTGCAETLGGILLLIPRTSLLGALICLADVIQVFTINMTYDVSRKLSSFHLLLITLFLLAPELPRLARFFLSNREVAPSSQPPLFRSQSDNRLALALQLFAGIYLLGSYAYGNAAGWYDYGGGRPKSQFYGIWTVDDLSIDGKLHPPLLTDHDRWRRVIFDFPRSVNFQGMDDSFTGYGASISSQDKTITLTNGIDNDAKANLAYELTAPDQLTLDGTMENHRIHMQLHRVKASSFPLAQRKFHWIAEQPFDRVELGAKRLSTPQ